MFFVGSFSYLFAAGARITCIEVNFCWGCDWGNFFLPEGFVGVSLGRWWVPLMVCIMDCSPSQLIVNRSRRRHNQLRSLWANDASFKKQIKLKYARPSIHPIRAAVQMYENIYIYFFRQFKQSNYGQTHVCRGFAATSGWQIKSKYRWRKNQLKSNKALGKYSADLKLFLCCHGGS